MSNRNFDSRAIIQRLQNQNYARNLYLNQTSGRGVINNPQNSDGDSSRYTSYTPGAQTEYFRGLVGAGETISVGGIVNILPFLPTSASAPASTVSASTAPAPTAPTVPSAPTITLITAGNAQLSVAFTASSDGGSAVTNYEYSTNGGTNFRAFLPDDTTSPVTITTLSTDGTTLLTNGTTYSVILRAVNAVGTGASSNTVSGKPATVPSAPTISTIAPGNTRLSVVFTAGYNGGSNITDYEYSTNNGSTFTSAGITSSPIVITGLSNETTYQVVIRAINGAGIGASSVAVSGTPTSDSIIASLTTSLSNYNSANVGDWVSITSSEWNNLKTNVSGTATVGASDDIMAITTPGTLASGLTNNPSSAIVTNTVESPRSLGIPANSYIYGFSVRFASNLGTSFGVFANTNTLSNTGFNQLGNPIPSIINGRNYFVQKGVSNTNGATAGLIGFFTGTKLDYPNGSFPGSAAYVQYIADNNTANPIIRWNFFNDSSIPTSSTILGGSLNNYATFCIQALTTTTKQWN